MRLQDKVAIVTGANREIGAAMAARLAADGARLLVAHYKETERVTPVIERIRAAGGTAETFDADLSTVEANRQLVARAVELYGRVDIFAANAGLTIGGPFLEMEESAYDTLVNLNLKGSFFGAQAAARQMAAQGVGQAKQIPYRIVLTSSVTGVKAAPGASGYAMTKAALRHLATTLSAELGRYGITVNAIAPGAILNERNLADDPNYEAIWDAITPVGRVGQPEDIANALAFLVSPDAEWVSGQTIIVDGGWSNQGLFPRRG